jgi:hypothetical protein
MEYKLEVVTFAGERRGPGRRLLPVLQEIGYRQPDIADNLTADVLGQDE